MVVVVPPPPTLNPDVVECFYVVDELLARSPVLIFYGPSATPTAAASNSRIQAHIFSPAGLQSYPRLTISPSSPLYSAVNCLPREEQGDEICRGLAFSLCKYFAELPQSVKNIWENEPSALGKLRSAPTLFSDSHAAILASRMVRVDNTAEVIKDVRHALADQSVSWLDLDVNLPPGSMKDISKIVRDSASSLDDEDVADSRYGELSPLVRLFGESAFLPTSRLRRAPSRPTALNRASTFTRKQKETLRREMCELLDTEENYVSKMYDLLHSVAADFRQKAQAKGAASSSPSEEALKGLFPESLDKILETNSAFLDDLRKVVEDTENDAIQDIESTTVETPLYSAPGTNTPDVTGAFSLATCLRTWFPKFAESYVDYMHAHSQFSQFLKVFMKETESSFSKRLQETGEQRLMSMLIEPVQRLPRYNLYIDNVLKQLPAKHPALKPLLNARDIISEICSQDSTAIPQSSIMDHLRRLIPTWPLTFRPSGRLVSAIDVVELAPPYLPDLSSPRSTSGILLLFADWIVILRKTSKASISARGLLAQVDGQDVAHTEPTADSLSFRQAAELNSFDVTEMDGGKMIQLIPTQSNSKQPALYGPPGSRPGSNANDAVVQVFYLTGAHEGKANRVTEDITKARVEGRFSETERESCKWEARSTSAMDLTFFVAISEAGNSVSPEGRGSMAKTRIIIQSDHKNDNHSSTSAEADVVASLKLLREDFYCLEISGPNGFNSKDNLTSVEFLPVLTKRLSNIFQMKYQIKNPELTKILLLRNQHILQSLKIVTDSVTLVSKASSRPHSPVKILTNLFGGSTTKDGHSFRKPHQPTMSMTEIPQIPRPTSPRRRSNDSPGKAGVATNVTHSASNALGKLEETLASYVIALQARKGNIVGRTLRARASADELAINELYNHLLEEPGSYQLAAQANVDVLFTAFEKFVKIAWQDKMGPIISRSTWSAIQSKLDAHYPGDFEEFFRVKFGEMSPQNQRALRAIVKLLADLLEGTGNDGDRGILTASFAEVLVPEGDPRDFVSVLDRLVEDIEALLVQETSNAGGSITSESRHRVNNTGSITSITSNASSIRKKFGFGALSRKGSKQSENESESVSVWRSLSKAKHNDGQSSSWSKASLGRSNSTDIGLRQGLSPKRPVSRDRPTVLGAFGDSSVTLSTIGEGQATGPPRKKRRSSLTDLLSLQNSASNTPTFLSPRTPTRPESNQRNSYLNTESPRTPSPTKQSLIPTPSGSTQVVPRGGSPTRREISPIRALPRGLSPSKSRPTTASSEEVSITSHSPARTRQTAGSTSNIPTLKNSTPTGLSERPTSGNVRKLPPPPNSIDKPLAIEKIAPLNPGASKLRMQSPQKLRERLQTEQKAAQSAEASLQAELTKIGEEIAGLGRSNTRTSRAQNNIAATPPGTDATAVKSLQTKLTALASKQSTTATTTSTRLDKFAADISSSLQVSEQRVKKLDELYREANAENEALYSRFNDELAKIIQKVRVGDGEAEMKRRMKELEDDVGRLRRENGRLKREVVGLRAQLKE